MDGAGWMIGTTCCTRTFESLAYISVSPASFFLLLKGLAEEVVVLCWFFGCVGLRLVCVWGCVLVLFFGVLLLLDFVRTYLLTRIAVGAGCH